MLRFFSNIFPCFAAESPRPGLPLQDLNPLGPSPDEPPSARLPPTHGPPPPVPPAAGLPGSQPLVPPVAEQPNPGGHVPENLIRNISSVFGNHSKRDQHVIEEVKKLTGNTQNNGTVAQSMVAASSLMVLNHPVNNQAAGGNDSQGANNVSEAFITEISAFYERFPNLNTEINVFVKPSGILYVLGTVHSDPRCADDVEQVINHVRPDTVIVELCANRACHCPKHVGNVFQSIPRFTFKYLFKTVRQVGFLEAFIVLSDIYRELNTPVTSRNGLNLGTLGGELMSALEAGSNLEGCDVVLGDRPIDITVQRQASLMGNWTAIRVVMQVTLALMIKKLRPQLMANSDNLIFNDARMYHVIVFERDLFLTYTMQTMADYSESKSENRPYRIVTVVGASHLQGIRKFWMKVKPEIIPFILARNV